MRVFEQDDYMIKILKQLKGLKEDSSIMITCPKCDNKMEVKKNVGGKVFGKCQSNYCLTFIK